MGTMPPRSRTGQVDAGWYASAAGRALLDSERALADAAFRERPGQPWLWLAPMRPLESPPGRGLALAGGGLGWRGAVACALPLPLPSESFGTVVLQHVHGDRDEAGALVAEAARILVPGGCLWLFALNPLAPYRWRWKGAGLRAAEPLTWRRRLRIAGMQPDAVSRGIGPSWQVRLADAPQDGPGMRAAYLIRSEKRALPLTPARARLGLRLSQGATAG